MYENIHDNQRMISILDNILEELHVGVCITDGEGIILRTGKSCEVLYGINTNYEGCNISTLEEDGIFNPSLTLIAIKEQRRVAMIQPDRLGNQLLVTAVPIFDPDTHKIALVISYASWDIVNLTELQLKYDELKKEVKRSNLELEAAHKNKFASISLIANSPKMQLVKKFADKYAEIDVDILLTGEAGTGKSNLAKYIHNKSLRKKQSFIEFSCADFAPDIIENELFGYVSVNAGTGEEIEKTGLVEIADQGTLLLEDIENLSWELQGTLLYLLKKKWYFKRNSKESRQVDIRLIATSRKSLDYLREHLRDGLFYHLDLANHELPSLKERTEDIPHFIELFLKRFNKKYQKKVTISEDAMSQLCSYDWPGNLEELKNVLQKLVLTMDEEIVKTYHLPENISPFSAANFEAGIDLKEYLEYYEGKIILQTYEKYPSTVKLAKYLGISQATAVRKLQKYLPNELSKNE